MSLKKQLGKSTAWMGLAASGMSVVSFLVFIVISRILSPSEIGLAVFAILVVEVGKVIINAGLTQSIVQRIDWNQEYSSTCFALNVIGGVLFTALIWLVGVPLTREFYSPAAVPVLQALSIIFLIEAVKVVHEGKMRREFLFKTIALRTIVASLISGVVGVTLALNGYGVWALVAQQIVGHVLVSAITLYSANWWPTLMLKYSLVKEALNFSGPLMVAQLINTLSTTIMDFMVGIILGPVALAVFRIAGRSLFILQDIIVRPFEHTALPVLARMKDKIERANATVRLIRLSNFIIVPIFFGASAVASDFIVAAFGVKWQTSGDLMTLLAIGSAPLLIRFQINAALIAEGASRWVMTSTVLTLLLAFTLGYFGIPYGLTYSALTYVAINYGASVISLISFKYVFQASITPVLKAILPSYIASSLMLAACILMKMSLPSDLNSPVRILILCATGGITYIALAAFIFRTETKNFLHEALSLAPAKISPLLIRLQALLKLA